MTGDKHSEPLLPWDGAMPVGAFAAVLAAHWGKLDAVSRDGMVKMVRKYEGGAEALAKHLPELQT